MSLVGRWNYLKALERQVPPAPIRVVYAKSGILLAAAVVEDRNAIIDHKLYYASFENASEAFYLSGLLNSETIRAKIAVLQSRGRFGARDFDKLVFELPIPRFDLARPRPSRPRPARPRGGTRGQHRRSVARRLLRSRAAHDPPRLQQKGLFQRLEELVAKLVP